MTEVKLPKINPDLKPLISSTRIHVPSHRVGILGGGQLALMLADAAIQMGLQPIILAESSEAPAAKFHPGAVLGSIEDEDVLRCFFSQVKTVIFENEFLNCKKLRRISSSFGNEFFPNLDIINSLQNKLNQKQILQSLKIPTAEFTPIQLSQPLKPQLESLIRAWGGALVLKWSKMGYDGKGVLIMNSLEEASFLPFCETARKRGISVYAERRVDFRRELALIAVRSREGEFASYPLVISEQENGICKRVYGPAVELGVSAGLQQKAQSYAYNLAQSTQYVGTFAMEFFETQQCELLVNEIAPRVHNSGHYTQDVGCADQFENHLRAVTGQPLGSTQVNSYFAMLNLLGPKLRGERNVSHASVRRFHPLPVPGEHSHLHWYGKSEIRPLRKLGHLNGTVIKKEHLPALFQELEASCKNWEIELGK